MNAPLTALQVGVLAIFDALHGARETCTDDQYRALLEIVQERLTAEHVRVAEGNAERFKKGDG